MAKGWAWTAGFLTVVQRLLNGARARLNTARVGSAGDEMALLFIQRSAARTLLRFPLSDRRCAACALTSLSSPSTQRSRMRVQPALEPCVRPHDRRETRAGRRQPAAKISEAWIDQRADARSMDIS